MELKSKITLIIGSGSRKFLRELYDKMRNDSIYVKPYCESTEDVNCPDFEELIKREVETLDSYAKRISLRLNEPIMPKALLQDVDGPFINVLKSLKRAYCTAKNKRVVLFLEDSDAGLNPLQQLLVGRIIAKMVSIADLYVITNVNSIDYLRGLTVHDTTIYVVMRNENNEMVLVNYARRDIIPPFFEAAALAVYSAHPED